MRVADAHDSPPTETLPLHLAEYQGWLGLARDGSDFLRLADELQAVPYRWVRWTESVVRRTERRGLRVANPIGYRLTVLHNGVVRLHEAKFLADMLENALRQGAIRHLLKSGVAYSDIATSLPDESRLTSNLRREGNWDLSNPLEVGWLWSTTYYQLSELLVRNWRSIGSGPTGGPGFRNLFVLKQHCRDVNLFKRDMYTSPQIRNVIAHSKRPIAAHELQKLFEISSRWMTPLGMRPTEIIRRHRNNRPTFLSDLALLEEHPVT